MSEVTVPGFLVTAIGQSPVALACIWIAHAFMKKHEQGMEKLVSTFENEVKSCESRYGLVFNELMKIKEQLIQASSQKG